MAMASSMSLYLMIASTGPKISSRTALIRLSQLRSTVGAIKKPPSQPGTDNALAAAHQLRALLQCRPD